MAPTDDKPTASAETLRRLALLAVTATIVLTAAAFWLSYEHLHDIADLHGLAGVRSWAWPSTIDLFIVIGEVLLLMASLRRRVDIWAIALTILGSGASIALNVAGVGNHAQTLDYIVAAVPPVAALLAFGALMRQIGGALISPEAAASDRRILATIRTVATASLPPTAPPVGASPTPPVVAKVDLAKRQQPTPPVASLPPTGDPALAPAGAPAGDNASASERQPGRQPVASDSAKKAPAQRQPRVRAAAKKTPASRGRSMDDWVELAGPIFHDEFRERRRQPTGDEFATAIRKAGLGTISASTAKNIRSEILDRADVPALSEEGA